MRRVTALAAFLFATQASAQSTVTPQLPAGSAARWFPVPASATFQTGDSWTDGGRIYRLYGVQSCLRNTTFTNVQGLKRDCGEASLAMLVALTRDLRPQCYAAAELPASSTVLVVCIAQPTVGRGAGSRIDLGTALIASGFAFAALTPNGSPVHAPYLVAQQVARDSHSGLWAFPDTPDPNAIILRAVKGGFPAPTGDSAQAESRRP